MIHVIGRPTVELMAFQEKDDDMNQYKDQLIYGVAVPAPENRWYSHLEHLSVRPGRCWSLIRRS